MQNHETVVENCFPILPSTHSLCHPKRIQVFNPKKAYLHFSSALWAVYIQCQNKEKIIKAIKRKNITMEAAQHSKSTRAGTSENPRSSSGSDSILQYDFDCYFSLGLRVLTYKTGIWKRFRLASC